MAKKTVKKTAAKAKAAKKTKTAAKLAKAPKAPKKAKKAAKKKIAKKKAAKTSRTFTTVLALAPPYRCIRVPGGCLKFYPDRDGNYVLPPGGERADCQTCEYWL